MSDTRTPGEIFFEAFAPNGIWDMQDERKQRKYEAGAAAVLAAAAAAQAPQEPTGYLVSASYREPGQDRDTFCGTRARADAIAEELRAMGLTVLVEPQFSAPPGVGELVGALEQAADALRYVENNIVTSYPTGVDIEIVSNAESRARAALKEHTHG